MEESEISKAKKKKKKKKKILMMVMMNLILELDSFSYVLPNKSRCDA